MWVNHIHVLPTVATDRLIASPSSARAPITGHQGSIGMATGSARRSFARVKARVVGDLDDRLTHGTAGAAPRARYETTFPLGQPLTQPECRIVTQAGD